ncbi:hypothetical protein AM587_10017604 [Phytophthora nicotianae]|nr:hypothetical protein AM587_10017604 [Phytophthora nicotianae]
MYQQDLEELLEDTPFRVNDPGKRSRFQRLDLTKLMLIVTRRKPYAAPYGKGDAEWQAFANDLNTAVQASFSSRACRDKVSALIKNHTQESDVSRRASGIAENHTELSDNIEAYLQLKTRFKKKRQTDAEKKKRKKQRIATAGSKAMRMAATRYGVQIQDAPMNEEESNSASTGDYNSEADHTSRQARREDRHELRDLLGSEYSSDEEEKREDSKDEGSGESREESSSDSAEVGVDGPIGRRKRLRVEEICAKEEELMEKEKEAQIARDTKLTQAFETLGVQIQALVQHLVNTHENCITNQ